MKKGRKIAWAAGSLLGLAALALIAMGLGRFSMSPAEVLATLFPGALSGVEVTQTMQNVVYNIRVPRVLLALLSGAGLSVAGHPFRACFPIRWPPRTRWASPRARPSARRWAYCSG